MKVDDKAYQEGLECFARGDTIRSVFEKSEALREQAHKDDKVDWRVLEARANSLTLGFADGFPASFRAKGCRA